MIRGAILFFLACGLSGGAMAATPVGAPSPATAGAGIGAIRFSPEGQAIAQKLLIEQKPRREQLFVELRMTRQQRVQLLSAASIDFAKLETIYRKEESLQGQLLTLENNMRVTLLRTLPATDRAMVVQAMIAATRPAGAPAPGN